MLKRENTIAQFITVIAVIEIIVGFFLGVMFGEQEATGYYYTRTEQNWGVTSLLWGVSFASAMFTIALAEIIEQLHQLNKKLNSSKKVDDDLELIKD